MDADLKQFVKEHLIKTNTVESNESLELLVDRQQKLVDAGYRELAKKTGAEIRTLKSVDNAQKYPSVLLLKRPHFVFGPLKHRVITSKQVLILSIVGLCASFGLLGAGLLINSAMDYSSYGYYGGGVASSIGAGGAGDIFAVTGIIGMIGSVLGAGAGSTMLGNQERSEPQYTHLKLPNSNKLLVECEPSDYLGTIPDSAVQTTIEMKKQEIQPKVWVVADEKEAVEQVRGQIPLNDPLLIGYHKANSGYVTVHAIWGEDIEDMDKLFSDSKVEKSQIEEPATKNEKVEGALAKHEKASEPGNQQTEINEAIKNKKYLTQP